MIRRLKCLAKGHELLCRQDYVLGPENYVQHAHVCLRCEKVRHFPNQPIEDEMVAILTSLVGAPAQTSQEAAKYIH